MLEYPQDSGSVQHATSHLGRGMFSSFTSSELIVVFVGAHLHHLLPLRMPGIPGRILFFNLIRVPLFLADYPYSLLLYASIGTTRMTPLRCTCNSSLQQSQEWKRCLSSWKRWKGRGLHDR